MDFEIYKYSAFKRFLIRVGRFFKGLGTGFVNFFINLGKLFVSLFVKLFAAFLIKILHQRVLKHFQHFGSFAAYRFPVNHLSGNTE